MTNEYPMPREDTEHDGGVCPVCGRRAYRPSVLARVVAVVILLGVLSIVAPLVYAIAAWLWTLA